MRHAARLAAAVFLAASLAGSCAHLNSPAGTVACLENSKDEKAAQDLIFALIDKDQVAALEAALAAVPDLVKCLLQKAASALGAGPTESARAKKARQFLDGHGLSGLMHEIYQKEGGGQYGAAGVGSLPSRGQAETSARPGPGADDPGAPICSIPEWSAGGGQTTVSTSGPYVVVRMVTSDGKRYHQAAFDRSMARALASALVKTSDLLSPGIRPGSGGG